MTDGHGRGHQVASLVNLGRGHGRQVDFRDRQSLAKLKKGNPGVRGQQQHDTQNKGYSIRLRGSLAYVVL